MLESIIKKIESTEKKELKKLEKYRASLHKQQQQEQFRMKNLLEDRKANLKMQILRKRELLEKLTIRQVQKEIQDVLGIAGSHGKEKVTIVLGAKVMSRTFHGIYYSCEVYRFFP